MKNSNVLGRKLDSTTDSAHTNTSPTTGIYLRVGTTNYNLTATDALNVNIRLTYYAKLYNRTIPVAST